MSRPHDGMKTQVRHESHVWQPTPFARAGRVVLLASVVALSIVAGVSSPVQSIGNSSQTTNGSIPGMSNPTRRPDTGGVFQDSPFARDQKELDELNRIRQKRLKSDTAKLLQLATELKAEVDKTTSAVLPVKAEQKAQQIEKLAHAVRDTMRESF